MPEIITIGETMAVFTPKSTGYLRYIRDYELRIAGAESNLAIGVAKLNHTAGWISSLGRDEFGAFVCNSIRAEGVDTSRVVWDANHRTGIMCKQIRNASETSVFYYRDDSAASHMAPAILDEEYIKESKILHLTGITPILGKTCRDLTEAAVEMAAAQGIHISFDPNIRRKLWGGNDYSPLLREIVEKAQIILMGKDEAEALFGISEPRHIMDMLFTKGNAKYVAIKDGAKGAVVGDKNQVAEIPPFPCCCVDPIGAGDAFNGAFLCGVLEGKNVIDCGRMGAVAGALATETYGDIEGYPSREQMEIALAGGSVVYR